MLRFFMFLAVFSSLFAQAQSSLPENKILGKTVGREPYLEYGLGTDRLGGAKMTYLDTGIVVRVVDSTIGRYKIQLSENRSAWLQKTDFRLDTTLVVEPYYLSGSILLDGDSTYDYVSLSLDEKLPYTSLQEINPSRIVVDIFGVTNNTNWITQRVSAQEVKNVYQEQIADDVYRLIIELKHPQHWGYTIHYEGKKLIVTIKRQPKNLDLDKMTIAIDAGHGGTNRGARGVRSKIYEKNYTLLIAKEIQKALEEKGATVIMTRTDDASLSMYERKQLMRAAHPDFMISVHLNSSVRSDVRGVSTYYRYIGFRPLTKFLQQSMIKIDGLEDFGNIGNFNFALLGPTDFPNSLLEVAFLSNREDEQMILQKTFRQEVAEHVVEGVKKWLKSCKEK